MKIKAASIGFLVAAIASAPISSALAHDHFHHHGDGPLLGLFAAGAAVVAGVATIVTAPIAILADVASGPRNEQRRSYDQQTDGYYGRGTAYNEEPSPYYADQRGAYAGPPRYNYPQRSAYSDPRAGYYYPSPPPYYGPQQSYAPPPGYYQREPDYSRAPSDGE